MIAPSFSVEHWVVDIQLTPSCVCLGPGGCSELEKLGRQWARFPNIKPQLLPLAWSGLLFALDRQCQVLRKDNVFQGSSRDMQTQEDHRHLARRQSKTSASVIKMSSGVQCSEKLSIRWMTTGPGMGVTCSQKAAEVNEKCS